MLQRPFYRKISPSVTDVGAVCDRPRATAGRPYGFFCEFFAILQQALDWFVYSSMPRSFRALPLQTL